MENIWQVFTDHIDAIISTSYAITAVFIILLVITENKSPVKALSWILVLSLIPIVGVLLYFFFGQRFRKQLRYSRREARYRKALKSVSRSQLKYLNNIDLSNTDEKIVVKKDIMHLLLRNDRAFISINNSVEILKNGTQSFDALKMALRAAENYIHIEFYILRFDNIGKEIFKILNEKARQGVTVRVIYDSVGSFKMNQKQKREALAAGVQMKSFQRVFFPFLSSKVNYRNHRKIVVIDGRVGFTGGLNVADSYIENFPGKTYWRDTFVRIEGDAVIGLQGIFVNDWFYVTKESLFDAEYFQRTKEKIDTTAQVISSGPDSKWQAISQFYFSAITSSKDYLYITTPYFVPNDEIAFALKAAALRGVDVRLLMPENSDNLLLHLISHSFVLEMLKAGVKVYMYQRGFIHSKLLISDHVLCSIGSANFDYRSLETNFEVSAVFYDEKVTSELESQFFDDLKDSKETILEDWYRKPKYKKFIYSASRIVSPLM